MQYTSANTSRFTFSIASQENLLNKLRVYKFTLKESISDHFYLNLDFLCEDQFLDHHTLLKKTALLTIQGEHEVQYLNGIICEASCVENGTRFARYSVVIVPMAWFLQYRKGCRIFQNLSVPEIITRVFNEAGLAADTHYQWSTDRQYPKREFCTQYNESEWQFVSRLMAEEGIHFHYQQTADKHLMILGDSKTALSFIEQTPTVIYKSNSGLVGQSEHINHFIFSQHTHSGKSTLRDYNFQVPGRSLEKSNQNEFSPSLEDYHYPGQYDNQTDAEFYAKLKQQQHNALLKTGIAQSNVQRLRAGRLFTQTGHRYKANNTELLIVQVLHEGKQPQSLDEDTPSGSGEGSSYHNSLTIMPADISFRPQPLLRKSLIHGQQNAFVTGPEGEEIYVNNYGQIKVQFLWDREGQYDEKTTCWLRANNEISGHLWGQIMTPRIGQQLFIEFEHGNPDRPVISGRCYNGDSLPPYSLPAHKTRSTTKSHSTPGGEGYNEIRYEDKKSQEQIYFHSEKDLDIRCKNDRREHIENTRSLIVDNEQHEHIKVDNHQKIDQNHQQKVGNNLSQNIGSRLHIQAGSNFLQTSGDEIHIKSADSTVLDAGSELTFKASGGFIKIDPSGVTINGITVNLNSGGSPGTATPSSPENPYQAVEADKNKPGQSYQPIAPEAPYQLSKFDFAQEVSNGSLSQKTTLSANKADIIETKPLPDEPFEIVIATKRQSIDQYLAQSYSDPGKVNADFKQLNSHLKNDRILPLQVIILPRQNLLECPKIPDEVTHHIQQVENTLATLQSPLDNELAYNHFDLLSTFDNVAQYGSAGTGFFASSLGKTNEAVSKTLTNIESAYIEHLNNPKSYPKAKFYQYRQQQLATLKSPMGSLLMKQMGYNTDTNIMRQLGLKEGKKKLLKGAKSGSLPSYAQNLERVARQAKLLKGLGQVSIALDVAHSGYKIHEACTTGREKECTKMKYTEGGRLTGGVVGGTIGGSAGVYFTCNILFGLETAGTSILWCALVAGGAGAYAGSKVTSNLGEKSGVLLYETFEND